MADKLIVGIDVSKDWLDLCASNAAGVERIANTRELVLSGTPYILPYRIVGDTIQILRVFHSARRWPDAL